MTGTDSARTGTAASGPRRVPWKTVVALAGLGVAFFFEFYWVMSLVYLAWAVSALRYRTAYFVEEIPRSRHPIIYWIIVLLWLFLAVWTAAFSPIVSSSWMPSDPAARQQDQAFDVRMTEERLALTSPITPTAKPAPPPDRGVFDSRADTSAPAPPERRASVEGLDSCGSSGAGSETARTALADAIASFNPGRPRAPKD